MPRQALHSVPYRTEGILTVSCVTVRTVNFAEREQPEVEGSGTAARRRFRVFGRAGVRRHPPRPAAIGH